jgi:N-acetylneuraminate synthase
MDRMVATIEIAGRRVGGGAPCLIVAEAGVNHNGSLDLAHRLVDVAIEAGADAIKFQSFKADRLTTTDAPKAAYQTERTAAHESQRDMLKRLELSADAHRDLMRHCRQRGILFLSTPFDEESADLLDALGIAAFKLPSGEVTNLPFLVHVAKKGKPLVVSTGMARLSEVETAVRTIEAAGNRHFALLHCVSNYPARAADVNLRAMQTMATAFAVPVGYSDHTMGIEVSLAAVALGACVIEKHFTLDRTLPGPDHQASLEPAELTMLVRGVRAVEAAVGDGRKIPAADEAATAVVARRSLVAARDLSPGTVLTEDLVAIKRPGNGLPPAMLAQVVGRQVNRAVRADALLTFEMLT